MNDQEFIEARKRNLGNILASSAMRKVILAGPGTGKTFTFKQVVAQAEGPVLALTFLGNLADDLERALGDRVDARTFHGYAKFLLHRNPISGVSANFDYYPAIVSIFVEDLICLGVQTSPENLTEAFMKLEEDDLRICTTIARGNYYDVVGHTDAVYRVFESMRSGKMEVPSYAQLLVDEYQDFNKLEVSLIHQLAEVSPTLIVGDDDQALYEFKHASPVFIRELLNDGTYVHFELPYCSRCTAILVDATHLIIREAQKRDLLQSRVDKPYICFFPEKRELSNLHPKIVHASCSVERNNAPYISRYIAEQIEIIPPSEIEANSKLGDPTVLIIGPSPFIDRVYEYLVSHGHTDVELRRSVEPKIHLLDGYKRLAIDERSRLGWRIILHIKRPKGWCTQVARTAEGEELADALLNDFRDEHHAVARVIRKVIDREALSSHEKDVVQVACDLTPEEISLRIHPPDLDPAEQPNTLITSLVGAKGLQADYVFIVGVNAGHFPLDNRRVTDSEVRQLIVALTRTKKQCTIVSCRRFGNKLKRQSVFVDWLSPFIEQRNVNKDYWLRANTPLT